MAHSIAAATTGEINYFYKDQRTGKILKVVRQAEIKQEPPIDTTVIYAPAVNNSNMGAFNQSSTSTQHIGRTQNPYNIHNNTTYKVIPQSSSSSMPQTATAVKYEVPDSPKAEERHTKYTHSNLKMKSKLHTTNSTHASVQKKRKPEKAGKGLRHFSMKVCEKVREKGVTSYSEVADELVAEEIKNNSTDAANCDEKNIRRRVYDALNVLMAMNIISKDKKEIRWIGLPSNSVEQCTELERENKEIRERINRKHQQLRELILQQVSFKSLIERNKEAERQGNIPTPNSSIQLPFIIVNTHKSTKINCSVTNDKSEYIFKFDDKFEMHDDAEVLKDMGLLHGLDKGNCSYKDIERAKTLVPPNFEKYIEAYGNGKGVTCDSDDDVPTYSEYSGIDTGHAYARQDAKTPEVEDDDDFMDNSDTD